MEQTEESDIQRNASNEESIARTSETSPVCLVYLVGLVYLGSFVQPNTQDRPNRPDRLNEQERLADFLIILLRRRNSKGTVHMPFGSRSHKNSGSLCCLAIQRAKTNNASLRRFRKRTRAGSKHSSLPNRTQRRSARRQIVLAWCNKLEIFPPPGRINSFRGGKSF